MCEHCLETKVPSQGQASKDESGVRYMHDTYGPLLLSLFVTGSVAVARHVIGAKSSATVHWITSVSALSTCLLIYVLALLLNPTRV